MSPRPTVEPPPPQEGVERTVGTAQDDDDGRQHRPVNVGRVTSTPVESEPVGVPVPIIDHRTTVMVTGTESGLGARVLMLLGNRPEFDIVPASVAMATRDELRSPADAGRIDIAVHLAAGDHDTR